jgi:hypothetical protein
MNLKLMTAGLLLALSLGAAPAFAVPGPPPIRVDLTIAYEPPPDPDFTGGLLTGDIHFLVPAVRDADVAFVPAVQAIDIGELTAGHSFKTHFQPTDPCIGGGTCQLHFAFTGEAGGFPTVAFADGSVFPSEAPGPPPIIPLGFLSGGPSPPPIHDSGPIGAFDAPVQVGTWSVTISAVPEPAAWALMLAGFAGLGLALRRQRAAA